MAPTPLKALLLAGGVAVTLAQITDPRVLIEQQQQEIEDCRAELVAARQDERSFRDLSAEEWAYKNLLDDKPIRFRATTDYVDRNGECDDLRTAQLEVIPGVAQVPDARMTLMPKEGVKRSKPITKNPIGFAMEYGSLGKIGQSSPDPYLLNLMANLNTKGSGPALSVGGNSAMLVRLNDSVFPAATENAANVTQQQLRALNSFSTAAKSPLTLGVSMLLRDTNGALDFISRGIMQNIDPANIERLELGNEPDHWQIEKKCYRKGNFTFDDYLAAYKEYEAAIIPYISATNITLQGPAVAGCNSFPEGLLPCWQMNLPRFAAETSQYTTSVSWHRYGNSGCSSKSDMRTLLSEPPNDDSIKGFAWLDSVQEQLEALNKTQTCSKSGAFSCDGIECLSGTFATTLWGLDQLFEILSRNSERVMFESVPDRVFSPYHVYTPEGVDEAKEVVSEGVEVTEAKVVVNDVATATTAMEAEVLPSTKEAKKGFRTALHRVSHRAIQRRDDVAQATDVSALAAGTMEVGAAATTAEEEAMTAVEGSTELDVLAGVETATDVLIETAVLEPTSMATVTPILSDTEAASATSNATAAVEDVAPTSNDIAAVTIVSNTTAVETLATSQNVSAVEASANATETVETLTTTSNDVAAVTVVPSTTEDVEPLATSNAVSAATAVPVESDVQGLVPETTMATVEDMVPAIETEATAPATLEDVVIDTEVDVPAMTTEAVDFAIVPETVAATSEAIAPPMIEPLVDGATTEAAGLETAETIVPVPTSVTVQPTVIAVEPMGNYTVTPPAATSNSVVRANPLFFAMWQMVRLIDDMPDAFIYQPNITLPNYDGSSIKTWAVGGTTNHTKVVFINKDFDQLEGTVIAIEGDFDEPCKVTRLVSNGVLTSTAYLAGQSIDSDGKPTGDIVEETVEPTNGVYELIVDQMTIVVVDIPVMAPGQTM